MKKYAILSTALVLALALAGCGGGTEATSESTTTTAPTTAEASGGASATVAAAGSDVSKATGVPRPFEENKDTPVFFLDALNKNQPVLVLFYGEDDLSQEVLAEIKRVYDDPYYKGGTVFLLVNIDDANDQTKKLAKEFSVGFIPYLAVVSRNKQITYEKNGYIDTKAVEQALYSAMNKQI